MALPARWSRQAITSWQRLLHQLPALSASSAQHCALISSAHCNQPDDGTQHLLPGPAVAGQTNFARHFSGQTTVQKEEIQGSWHFPVAVGSTLSVSFSSTDFLIVHTKKDCRASASPFLCLLLRKLSPSPSSVANRWCAQTLLAASTSVLFEQM